MNMDQLIEKLLTDSKARSEWLEVAKKLEERCPTPEDKSKEENKSLPLKVISRSAGECCRLSYKDGFSLCFMPDGGMFLEFVEPGTEGEAPSAKSIKTILEENPKVFKSFSNNHLISIEDLMYVVTHVGFMFSREAVNAFERNKKVVAQSEQKTRFMSNDKKRAFVAGMVCGRNTI